MRMGLRRKSVPTQHPENCIWGAKIRVESITPSTYEASTLGRVSMWLLSGWDRRHGLHLQREAGTFPTCQPLLTNRKKNVCNTQLVLLSFVRAWPVSSGP